MDWHPLRLTTPVKQHVFGGRAIAERLGRTGLPNGPVAETWEMSDVDGDASTVLDGPLAGRTLRQIMADHPEELLGPRVRPGPRFPLLTKFIDGSRPLPVHLHADDTTARRLEGEPHGKTEAWHVLDAAPGATALVGTRPGVDRDTLHRALLAQDFDAVMRRLPVRAGQTVHVPGGTLHSFGPGTLVYEIEQTSDIQQHAMRTRMEDGSPVPEPEWLPAWTSKGTGEWYAPCSARARTSPWNAGPPAPPPPGARLLHRADPQQRRSPGDRHLRPLDRPPGPGSHPAPPRGPGRGPRPGPRRRNDRLRARRPVAGR
ncbi:type I phosphomannose isomerase catalytic subunit [Streptomyces afghaniensis]